MHIIFTKVVFQDPGLGMLMSMANEGMRNHSNRNRLAPRREIVEPKFVNTTRGAKRTGEPTNSAGEAHSFLQEVEVN
eukprot:3989701-Amphidinium_carterae.1